MSSEQQQQQQQQQPLLIQAKKWELSLFGWKLASRFSNPWPFELPSGLRFVLYLLGPRHRARPAPPDADTLRRLLPVASPDFSAEAPPTRRVSCTWLGHASCLFTFARSGVRILCDPLLGERASPVQWLGPSRQHASPCSPDQLPQLTAVCISHNHFDHLDSFTLRRVCELQPEVHFCVPAGDKQLLVSLGANPTRVHELLWWQSVVLDNADGAKVEVTFTPASHWSGRTLVDKNRSLWGSFVLEADDCRVFFAGDTGYRPEIFDSIAARFPSVQLAALPIGAYAPRDIFEAQHVSPTEAVTIHKDVRSEKSVGIHWGAFCLSTTEGLLQPREDLLTAVKAAGCEPDDFVTVNPGESVHV